MYEEGSISIEWKKVCTTFFRGADPNDPGPKGVTPLMIACKHGRDENVKELLAMEDQNIDDLVDAEEVKKPRVTIDVKNKHTKAAIHYAAKKGHLVSTAVVFNFQKSVAGMVTLILVDAMQTKVMSLRLDIALVMKTMPS